MSKQAITDKYHRPMGYIETMKDGKQRALDKNHRVLGHYDPKSNTTMDANYRTIGRGNSLAALIPGR